MDIDADKYMDLKGLSEYSSLKIPTLRDRLRDVDPLPHFKVKGKILVKKSEFDTWMESRFRVRESRLTEVVESVMASLDN